MLVRFGASLWIIASLVTFYLYGLPYLSNLEFRPKNQEPAPPPPPPPAMTDLASQIQATYNTPACKSVRTRWISCRADDKKRPHPKAISDCLCKTPSTYTSDLHTCVVELDKLVKPPRYTTWWNDDSIIFTSNDLAGWYCRNTEKNATPWDINWYIVEANYLSAHYANAWPEPLQFPIILPSGQLNFQWYRTHGLAEPLLQSIQNAMGEPGKEEVGKDGIGELMKEDGQQVVVEVGKQESGQNPLSRRSNRRELKELLG